MKNKLTYISLFSSAGVGCYGFKKQSFQCVLTNELLPRRMNVQKANKKCKYESGYILGDILIEETKSKISAEIDKWNKSGYEDITAVIATPPCQGMSVANHKKKDEGKRNSLVVESLKIIKQVRPQFFILENVRAFLTTACTDTDGQVKKIKDAIIHHLDETYDIEYKVLNFKNYGANSSRTRTLVIGVRKDMGIKPEEIYPKYTDEKTLREVIGYLPRLNKMGEIDKNDIYHSFRNYKSEMRLWIENLKEGECAFDNTESKRIPHYYKNGEKIYSKNGNGDKYTRQYWDKVAPCIHTRNDILASQNTVHPEDDRVFSVRELMKLMSIPDDFKWSDSSDETLNNMTEMEKIEYIKEHDINIRQSIGEAVPTEVFSNIAKNIKKALNDKCKTR